MGTTSAVPLYAYDTYYDMRNLYKPALQKHYRDKTARNRITRRMICAGTNF
jgi:hypothetical protein